MSKKIFIVTGANKGIGYGIVRGLAEKVAPSSVIYLTARNPTLGKESLAKLEDSLADAKKAGRAAEIRYHQLDISDEASCKSFAEHLKKEHGQIDVLINNAGIAFKNSATDPPEVQAEVTLAINYYGTKLVSHYLVPLIRDGGRVVNVASGAGTMQGRYSDALIEKFQKVGSYTEQDVDNFVEQYKKFAKEGTRKENGYPETAYGVSKAAEIAYTLLQQEKLKGRGIIINACCPGYVDTDMTSHKGTRTIEEGADTPIFLAIDPNTPSGKFVRDRTESQWP